MRKRISERRRAAVVTSSLSLAAMVGVGLIAVPAVAADTALAPTSMTTTSGEVGDGQDVAPLATKDQSGKSNNWSKYVEFSGRYDGYRGYTLPASVARADVAGITVAVNYRGPSSDNQTWTWSVYDWTAKQWRTAGTNADAPDWGAWKNLTFSVNDDAHRLVSAQGDVRVRLTSNNASDAADIDYEAVTVTTRGGAAQPTPSVTPTPPKPTASATPKPTPTASVTPKPTPSPTVTTPSTPGTYRLPPANEGFSYQLGGYYDPEPGVKVVSRDRTAPPAAGYYNICYVNLLQTQPDEERPDATDYGTTAWWEKNHPDLLVRDSSGRTIVDENWNEALLDVSTAAKRSALLKVQSAWFQGCKDDGFDAIEPDNLDSFLRAEGRLSFAAMTAYLKLVIPDVHARGLAIAQKNTVGDPSDAKNPGFDGIGTTFVDTVSPRQGFDFAIAEACAEWKECPAYVDLYGARVFEIEYPAEKTGSTDHFTKICQSDGAKRSIILRDEDVKPVGKSGYLYRAC